MENQCKKLQKTSIQKIFKYGGDGRLESVALYIAACFNKHGVSRQR